MVKKRVRLFFNISMLFFSCSACCMHNKSLAENEKFTLLNEFNITDHEITISDISKNGKYVAMVLHADSKRYSLS